MSHIKNKGIFYVANGTDPNILGITPTSNLGLCKTQDGTKEWNYNDTLAPGSKWVLKDGGKKVYKALLTQNSTDAPTAVVLENTLGGDITWTRNNEGYYIATLTGGFPDLNKLILPQSRYIDIFSNAWLNVLYGDPNSIEFNTSIIGGVNEDSWLLNTPIIIEVYP